MAQIHGPNPRPKSTAQIRGPCLTKHIFFFDPADPAGPAGPACRYVHTKFMLIDPLGEHPVVVSGSANFSAASTTNNDENMLVIYGEAARGIAHVYLTEFMRLFDHFQWRSKLLSSAQKTAPGVSFGKGRTLSQEEKSVVETHVSAVSLLLCHDDGWLRAPMAPGSKERTMREYFMRGEAGSIVNVWPEERPERQNPNPKRSYRSHEGLDLNS